MVRYPCSALPGYSNATTGGENPETSGLPTACYNTCPNKNVLDESNSIIGSSAANPGIVYFAGTIAAYNYENATVTTDGSYPACTYEAPVCNDGYHTAGMTCEPNIYTFTFELKAEWMKTNTIPPEMLIPLTKGVRYKLSEGKWTVDGDKTVYNAGSVYVNESNDHTFHKVY
jgi:hypothetical protein